MSLTESTVEDAALEWFGELGYAVWHGPHLAPGEYAESTLTPALSQGEGSHSEMVCWWAACAPSPPVAERFTYFCDM